MQKIKKKASCYIANLRNAHLLHTSNLIKIAGKQYGKSTLNLLFILYKNNYGKTFHSPVNQLKGLINKLAGILRHFYHI